MAISLPKEFKDVPLAHLWEMLKVCKELKELAASAEDKAWCDGFYNFGSILLGDLTNKHTRDVATDTGTGTSIGNQAMSDIYKDFIMENRLLALGDEIKENGGFGL